MSPKCLHMHTSPKFLSGIGSGFWKCSKWKIYAIADNSYDSDDEPRSKKLKLNVHVDEMIIESLSAITLQLDQLKAQVEEIRMCTADNKVSVALKSSLSQMFQVCNLPCDTH